MNITKEHKSKVLPMLGNALVNLTQLKNLLDHSSQAEYEKVISRLYNIEDKLATARKELWYLRYGK